MMEAATISETSTRLDDAATQKTADFNSEVAFFELI